MQVLPNFEGGESAVAEEENDTYFSAAVFQQNVDVLLVLEMVIKVHNVFVV